MRHSKLLADRDDSQLLVIDIQERLAAAMAEADHVKLVKHSSVLLQAAARLAIPVVLSEQYPRGLGHTEEAVRTQLPAGLVPIEKTCFSCAASPDFLEALDRDHRRQVILTGMESHVCVLQSALELQARGHQVFVVEDAVCSRQTRHHVNAIARLREAGIIITNTESVLFEWLRDARHEHFKTLSALIK